MTGWRSVGELLMTRRISLVAVCCSSASVRSRLRACSSWNKRTFSMAITAWSAKVSSSLICLSENGRRVPVYYGAAACGPPADRSGLPDRNGGREGPVTRHMPHDATFDPVEGRIRRLAEPRGALDDREEHRLELRRGAGDHAQDL